MLSRVNKGLLKTKEPRWGFPGPFLVPLPLLLISFERGEGVLPELSQQPLKTYHGLLQKPVAC